MKRRVIDEAGVTWAVSAPPGPVRADRLRPSRCVVRAVGGSEIVRFQAPVDWVRLSDDQLLEMIASARP